MKKILLVLIIAFSLVFANPVLAATTTKNNTYYNYYNNSYYPTSITTTNKTGARLDDNSGYTNTCKRDSTNNYGVVKKVKFDSNKINRALNTPCVDINDIVYDFSDVLDLEEEKKVKELLTKFSQEFNMPAIFVSYNLPYTYDKDNEDFIADFYDYNSFNAEDNNFDGIAIFRNTYAADPYVRIMTYGDAQMYLYDTRYDTLISGVKNYFIKNDYEGAVNYTLNYYRDCVKKGQLKGYYVDDYGWIHKKWYPSWAVYIIGGLVVGLIYMLVGLGKHKMVKKAKAAQEYFVQNSLNLSVSRDTFIRSHTSSYTTSSSSGGGGGGHHSSGGSSGFGHSSGGGHF